jgi:deaminated glutathione amidase
MATILALAQMTTTADLEGNLEKALSCIRQAQSRHAAMIAFPENFLFIGDPKSTGENSDPVPESVLARLSEAAISARIWILMGSLFERDPLRPGKFFNTSVLIDTNGKTIDRYQKIHLFDNTLPGLTYCESDTIRPGNRLVVCDSVIGRIGLSICYDIRFPVLYQRLAHLGAQTIFIPSAFTVPTGQAHWMTLLKARAIENQVYIAAPAQYGRHNSKRISYGHSAIIDPWGDVIALAEEREELIFGEIDLARLEELRRRMPVMHHQVSGIDKD